MQPVPALHAQGLPAQLVIAGHAPHVRGNLVALLQNLLRPQGFVENRAAAEKLHRGPAGSAGAEAVDALQNVAGSSPSGMGGMG